MSLTPEQHYVRLTLDKRGLQARLKLIDAELAALETELLSNWQGVSISQLKVEYDEANWLLYQSTRVFARQEFVNLAEVPQELHMLSVQKAASLLSEYTAQGDKEGLERLANLGITPFEKTQIHVKRG